MTSFINQEISRGQSGEDIIQTFVTQYGEQVLATPPKRGFNLVVWIVPFIAILGGGGVAYIALKRWVARGQRSQIRTTPKFEEEDEEYQRQLKKELEEFKEKTFR
jgi:cytochrome c-type biogenesis protein CcmH